MKRLKVRISKDVSRMIREQAHYIARRSPANAAAWNARMRFALKNLADVHGYAIDEKASARLGQTLRKMVFEKTYLVHFTIDEKNGVIQVVGFRHGARRPYDDEA